MHQIRRIEEIRSTMDKGEKGAGEIRAAACLLEGAFGVGDVLTAVSSPDFPDPLVAAADGCGAQEEIAWLTLAAAGAQRARQVLAWRASLLLDPAEVVTLTACRRRDRRRGFEILVATAPEPAAAAWALLASLDARDLRAMVTARPALAAADRHARGVGGRAPSTGSCPAFA
jgi:hypothetical protein